MQRAKAAREAELRRKGVNGGGGAPNPLLLAGGAGLVGLVGFALYEPDAEESPTEGGGVSAEGEPAGDGDRGKAGPAEPDAAKEVAAAMAAAAEKVSRGK